MDAGTSLQLDQIKVEIKEEPINSQLPIQLEPFEELTLKSCPDALPAADITSIKQDPATAVPQMKVLKRIAKISDKGFSCNSCNKTLKTKALLRKHFETDNPDQDCQLTCGFCKKIFNFVSTLKQHLVWHTGERPYKCCICLQKFGAANDLRRHMPRHVTKSPFKCHICPKGFLSNRSLIMHVRGHEGIKPWQCVVCQRSFVARKYMTSHQKMTHKVPIVTSTPTVIPLSRLRQANFPTVQVVSQSNETMKEITANPTPCTLTFEFVRNGKLVKKQIVHIPRPDFPDRSTN